MPALIQAAKLDRRIRIERATVAANERGNDEKSWFPLCVVWAQKMSQRAVEAWKAGGTAAELETAWRIRWSSQVADVSPEDRLIEVKKVGDEYVEIGPMMAILGATDVGRREGREIVTKSVAPGAA